MSQPKTKTSRAGGAIIALTITGGAFIGTLYRQPSIGILIGTATGLAITIALYLYDRRS